MLNGIHLSFRIYHDNQTYSRAMSMNIALKMTFYLGSENGMCHTGKGAGGMREERLISTMVLRVQVVMTTKSRSA